MWECLPLLGPTISAIFGWLHLAFVAGLRSMTMSMTSHTWRALGQVVLVYFAVGGAAVTAQDSRPARATFAEMIAFARIASVACQRLAPDADSFHALALRGLIKPPITEEEIAAKEKNIKPLRKALPDILSSNTPALSPRMVNLIAELVQDWRRLDERIAAVSAEIESLAEQDEGCQFQALQAGAARISRGDLSQRISIKTGDELETLADQINAMAGKLRQS
jgi:HAMP domain